ncbi:MAG: bifunctional folylpolyglutamate synthase/dihydrofolate synthase [Pseudodesulfovibrio sp.]
MTHFKNYTELEAYMDKLGLFHMDLSLGRMEAFWQSRGLSDIPVVQVVGTNGKGSTSTFFCSIARAHGLKTGLFTSPHFVTPRERAQVNRTLLSRETWVELANEVLATPGGEELTYFEFQACLAMIGFVNNEVDIIIMEAGLGGKFDASNVFEPVMTLFTPIGMDHEKILGPTLRDIARDKAGAIRPGGLAVTGTQVTEAMIPLQDRAKLVGARLLFAVDMADPVNHLDLGLMGIHQTANGRLALAAWRWYAAGAGIRSVPHAERFGLESAFLPGRMQQVEIDGQTILLDGAHNPPALEALSSALRAEDIALGAVVFTCMGDKDVDTMVPLILGLTDGPFIIPAMENERACDPATFAEVLGERAQTAPSMADALAQTQEIDGPVLICGSLYLLAEFYTLYPEFLTP